LKPWITKGLLKSIKIKNAPQRSVLGLLLFLIYNNDIYQPSNKLGFYLFADDPNLLYADNDLKPLETADNYELNNDCHWLDANKLTINARNQTLSYLGQSKKDLIISRVSEFRIITIMDSRILNAKIRKKF